MSRHLLAGVVVEGTAAVDTTRVGVSVAATTAQSLISHTILLSYTFAI